MMMGFLSVETVVGPFEGGVWGDSGSVADVDDGAVGVVDVGGEGLDLVGSWVAAEVGVEFDDGGFSGGGGVEFGGRDHDVGVVRGAGFGRRVGWVQGMVSMVGFGVWLGMRMW